MNETPIKIYSTWISSALFESGFTQSKGQGARLIHQHAVKIDDELVTDPQFQLEKNKVYKITVGSKEVKTKYVIINE